MVSIEDVARTAGVVIGVLPVEFDAPGNRSAIGWSPRGSVVPPHAAEPRPTDRPGHHPAPSA